MIDRPPAPAPQAASDPIGDAIRGAITGIASGVGRLIEGIFGGGRGKKDGPDGEVIAVRSGANTSGKKPVLFVNGAGTNRGDAIDQANAISGFLGRRDIDLVHNATEIAQHDNPVAQLGGFLGGFQRDVDQVRGDFRGEANPAAVSLSARILERLRGDGEPIEIAAVSQGTLIARNAIESAMRARRDELARTLDPAAVERQLARDLDRIHYANIAGAVRQSDFPAGLTHYIDVHDDRDPVVNRLGARRGNISAAEWDRRASTIAADLALPGGLAHGAILTDARLQQHLRDFYTA